MLRKLLTATCGLSLLVGWFTPFLIQGLGFTQKEASWITTLPWAASPFVVITSGWLSQQMLAQGVGTRWARGVFGAGCVALGGLALIAMPFVPGSAPKITMMVIGISVPAVIYVMGHAMVSEFTPVSQRGAMLAINNAIATSAGLFGPYVMGSVVQNAINAGATAADGYTHGFMICGIVALGCGLVGMLFLRPQHEAARFARSAVPMPVAAVVHQLIQGLVGRGYGDSDFAALLQQEADSAGLLLVSEHAEVSDGLGSTDTLSVMHPNEEEGGTGRETPAPLALQESPRPECGSGPFGRPRGGLH